MHCQTCMLKSTADYTYCSYVCTSISAYVCRPVITVIVRCYQNDNITYINTHYIMYRIVFISCGNFCCRHQNGRYILINEWCSVLCRKFTFFDMDRKNSLLEKCTNNCTCKSGALESPRHFRFHLALDNGVVLWWTSFLRLFIISPLKYSDLNSGNGC